jgi:hypothetical protein
MPDAELAARIARIEAREELRDLIARYCHLVDGRDFDGIVALFAPHGSFSTPWDRAEGHDALHTWFETRIAKYEFTYHFPHSQLVEFHGDDRATGVVSMHAEHGIDGVCKPAGLRYDDEYVRTNGVWRFASRHLSFRYYLAWSEMNGAFHEGAVTGRPASAQA